MAEFDRDSRIGFIGAGNVAKSFAVALTRQGYRVVAAASRSFSSAEDLAGRVDGCVAYESLDDAATACDVVFVTTPDDSIPATVESVSWRTGQAVVHTSGVLTLEALDAAARAGASPGAFHPMQLFSSPETGVEGIPGTTFGIAGDAEMAAYLEEMALAIGGRPVFVRAEDKPLYHLSGVMMGGLLSSPGGDRGAALGELRIRPRAGSPGAGAHDARRGQQPGDAGCAGRRRRPLRERGRGHRPHAPGDAQ